MEVRCKTCGRIYRIDEKKLRQIRPSSYLCPACRDTGGKAGLSIGAALLVVGGILLKLIRKK